MSDADKVAILRANIQKMETLLNALQKLRAFAQTAEQKQAIADAIKLGKEQLAELQKRVVNYP